MMHRMTLDVPDRRARRREQTIEEILDIAEAVITTEGVNGLSLAEVARRLGVRPPSLYQYFPSLMALYDALFLRGQSKNVAAMHEAMATARPGVGALRAGLEATLRWSLAHQGLAQLMFWRPVPSFEPSPEAYAPAIEMVDLLRASLTDAVAMGELGPGADSDDGAQLLSILISGLLSQAMSNEPDVPFGEGRYTPQFGRIMDLFVSAYPPPKRRSR
jgi:AcrR family transcriptional regulator